MARLTYFERKHMPKSEFAVPGKREGGKGGYPINDMAHARNALSRVSQFGSSTEKAEVRAKVHAKYPDIGKPDHKAEHNDNGMIKALHAHADSVHPVKR